MHCISRVTGYDLSHCGECGSDGAGVFVSFACRSCHDTHYLFIITSYCVTYSLLL